MFIKKLAMIILFIISVESYAQNIPFDIGTSNWLGNFPGAGTYDQTVSGVQVMGIAERIVSTNIDPTAVFSGNDSPAVPRNYSYVFPPGSTVSIDFFHLTTNSTNQSESLGSFSIPPSSSVIGNGHNLVGTNLELVGSSSATVNTVTTLTWESINALNFDIATNGNVAFVGHRNMLVSVAVPRPIPLFSSWSRLLLSISTILLAISQYKYINNRKRTCLEK